MSLTVNTTDVPAVVWSSPLGDESAVVLEGSAVITVTETGKQYEVGPGSIIYEPKGVEQSWEIKGPYFKKAWVIWDGTEPTNAGSDDLIVANVNGNPDVWTPYDFTEPLEGDLTKGELVILRPQGSTGTLLWPMASRLWSAAFVKRLVRVKVCAVEETTEAWRWPTRRERTDPVSSEPSF